MPYEIHQMPYTDLHSLNLDWLIKKLKDIDNVDEYVSALFEQALADGSIQAELEASYDSQTEELTLSVSAGRGE